MDCCFQWPSTYPHASHADYEKHLEELSSHLQLPYRVLALRARVPELVYGDDAWCCQTFNRASRLHKYIESPKYPGDDGVNSLHLTHNAAEGLLALLIDARVRRNADLCETLCGVIEKVSTVQLERLPAAAAEARSGSLNEESDHLRAVLAQGPQQEAVFCEGDTNSCTGSHEVECRDGESFALSAEAAAAYNVETSFWLSYSRDALRIFDLYARGCLRKAYLSPSSFDQVTEIAQRLGMQELLTALRNAKLPFRVALPPEHTVLGSEEQVRLQQQFVMCQFLYSQSTLKEVVRLRRTAWTELEEGLDASDDPVLQEAQTQLAALRATTRTANLLREVHF